MVIDNQTRFPAGVVYSPKLTEDQFLHVQSQGIAGMGPDDVSLCFRPHYKGRQFFQTSVSGGLHAVAMDRFSFRPIMKDGVEYVQMDMSGDDNFRVRNFFNPAHPIRGTYVFQPGDTDMLDPGLLEQAERDFAASEHLKLPNGFPQGAELEALIDRTIVESSTGREGGVVFSPDLTRQHAEVERASSAPLNSEVPSEGGSEASQENTQPAAAAPQKGSEEQLAAAASEPSRELCFRPYYDKRKLITPNGHDEHFIATTQLTIERDGSLIVMRETDGQEPVNYYFDPERLVNGSYQIHKYKPEEISEEQALDFLQGICDLDPNLSSIVLGYNRHGCFAVGEYPPDGGVGIYLYRPSTRDHYDVKIPALSKELLQPIYFQDFEMHFYYSLSENKGFINLEEATCISGF